MEEYLHDKYIFKKYFGIDSINFNINIYNKIK